MDSRMDLFLGDSDLPELERFKLSSVVVHSGMSAESGHYYCYAKQSEDTNGHWCLFNDNHVSLTTFQSLNNLSDKFSRDTAYVLFYARANNQFSNEDDRELIDRHLRRKIEDDNLAFEKVGSSLFWAILSVLLCCFWVTFLQ